MRKILLIFYICTLFADDNIKIHDLYNLQEELKKESPVARQCAPWRSKYKRDMPKPDGCIMCRCATEDAAGNFILKKYKYNTVMLNLYPYTSWGHFLIIPHTHVSKISLLDTETKIELMQIIGVCEKILLYNDNADSLNIGINIGEYSGASIPEHLHIHVVSRKKHFQNFVSVVGNLLVCELNLEEQQERFAKL